MRIGGNEPPKYELNTVADLAEGGTATDETNAGPYEEGDVVNIKAEANEGWEFVNWTAPAGSIGDPTNPETTFTMPAENVTVTANFEMIDYTVSLTIGPGCTGTLTGRGTYNFGDSVTVVANPKVYTEFVNWTDDDDGDAVISEEESYTFTMPANDVNYTANFVMIDYEVNLSVEPANSGTVEAKVDGVPTSTYNFGDFVDIEATPAEGWEFVNWTDDDDGDAEVSTDANYRFAMGPDEIDDVNYTANFVMIDYTVEYDANTGVNAPTDSDSYNFGGEVLVLGIGGMSKEGHTFNAWNTVADGTGDSYNPDDTFTMPAENVTLYAQWDEIPTYVLTLDVEPEQGGNATDMTDTGPYEEGDVVNIKAEANDGFEFVNWTSEEGTFDDDEAEETTFTMPAENVTVTANFEIVSTTTPENYFTFDSATGTITGYDSNGPKDVVIPSQIGGVDVTAIGSMAFFDSSQFGGYLKSLVLPETLETIANSAFLRAFDATHNQANDVAVIIPDGVKTIGNQAFQYNKLAAVTLPEGLESIGQSAFDDNRLTELTIPSTMTVIESWAFGNNELTEVTIPDNITEIQNGAFGNNEIVRVTIGANVDIQTMQTAMGIYGAAFETFYSNQGKAAGTYVYEDDDWKQE